MGGGGGVRKSDRKKGRLPPPPQLFGDEGDWKRVKRVTGMFSLPSHNVPCFPLFQSPVTKYKKNLLNDDRIWSHISRSDQRHCYCF